MGLFGALASSGTKFGLQKRQFRHERREAKKHRAWQKHQTDTSHQREVRDLRRAGLNPILSAGGQGAASAQGAMAQVPDYGDAVDTGVKGAATAISAKIAKHQIGVMTANQENIEAGTAYKVSQTTGQDNQNVITGVPADAIRTAKDAVTGSNTLDKPMPLQEQMLRGAIGVAAKINKNKKKFNKYVEKRRRSMNKRINQPVESFKERFNRAGKSRPQKRRNK